MYKGLLYLIKALHSLLILFLVIIPFSNANWLLLIHAIVIPFIVVHWIFNNNTCALTVAEHYITEKLTGKKIDKNSGFMAHLINPVYDFAGNHKNINIYIYLIVAILFVVSAGKLIFRRIKGKIKTFRDIFAIDNSNLF
jgi:hypothetical protein